MNRTEYIESLRRLLSGLSDEDRNDIIYDYEEHFRMGVEDGKSEEEIAKSLGDPRNVARQYKVDYAVRRAEDNRSITNISSAVWASIGLGFLNVVFVLGPFIGLAATVFAIFVSAVAVTAAGAATLLAVIFQPFLGGFVEMGVSTPVAIFAAIGITSLGLLFLAGAVKLAQLFYKVTLAYLRFNIKVITGRGK
ncbi:MAG: DUF1700 domain-containing protein [Clostridia bacterium]|nr:DUF1700 domain-containing protein [Clostridia bacterium]